MEAYSPFKPTLQIQEEETRPFLNISMQSCLNETGEQAWDVLCQTSSKVLYSHNYRGGMSQGLSTVGEGRAACGSCFSMKSNLN